MVLKAARLSPIVLLVLAFAGFASACSTADSSSASPAVVTADADDGSGATRGELDRAVDELRASGFNGVVLIETPDEFTITGIGVADREQGLEFAADTVVDIGSLTKQFTGAAILRLEMDGKVSVDDQLLDYFPGLPPAYGAITLHQLLTHTAGLPPALGGDYSPIERDAFVDLVADHPLEVAPGTAYEYSNVGYSLLAAVIETVTGASYETYLRSALFEPAGMTATGYVLPDWDTHVVAVGYDGDESVGRPHEQPWADDGPYWHLRGNGGLLSTVEDLYRWHVALLGGDVLDDDAKAQYYGRHTPEGPGADSFYGYGWAVFPTDADTSLIAHNGGNGIFFADFLRYLDDGVTVILATNSVGPADEDAALRLAGAALDFEVVAGCMPGDLAELERIEGFPDTAAGRAASELLAVLTEPDRSARTLAFVDRLLPAVTGGGSRDEVIAEVAAVQAELAGATVIERYREDDLTFHARLQSDLNHELFVSARMDVADPNRISCVDISD